MHDEIMTYKPGTLVSFSSSGSIYTGFIIGTCSYDAAGPDNAYVVRYVYTDEADPPTRPHAVVGMNEVETVAEFPEDFFVGGYWSATPDDRCDSWDLQREGDRIMVVPRIAAPVRSSL